MDEGYLTEQFLECFTIQELVAIYRGKQGKEEKEMNIFYQNIVEELRKLGKEKYDALLIEMKKVDGKLAINVNDRNEHSDSKFPFHINPAKKSIRAIYTLGRKAIFRDY